MPALRWMSAAAILLSVGSADIERALKIARSPDAERARVHARYIVPLEVNRPDVTLERIEVVTEFRRALLDAEARHQRGEHVFTVREVADVLRPSRGKVTLSLRLRFNPQNVLVTVPSYEIEMGERGPVPGDVRRSPLFTLGSGDPKKPSALYGAIVDADFDAAQVGQASREVRVMLDGQLLARTTIDFATID
jgi:hypothetical protein